MVCEPILIQNPEIPLMVPGLGPAIDLLALFLPSPFPAMGRTEGSASCAPAPFPTHPEALRSVWIPWISSCTFILQPQESSSSLLFPLAEPGTSSPQALEEPGRTQSRHPCCAKWERGTCATCPLGSARWRESRVACAQ